MGGTFKILSRSSLLVVGQFVSWSLQAHLSIRWESNMLGPINSFVDRFIWLESKYIIWNDEKNKEIYEYLCSL